MKLFGISSFLINVLVLSIPLLAFNHIFDRIPKELSHTDYMFIVEIDTQTNYLFYKKTLINTYKVSTGSKTRYKGNREMKEAVWRLGQRIESGLKPIYGARLIYLEKYRPDRKIFVKTNKAFHGTNEPHNIGKPTSMGCVYHFDNDIIDIYSFIPDHSLVVTVKLI
ncbi:MAG: L,D-transpeptidase [Candidatus Marinamargulisbacteria bacterium]